MAAPHVTADQTAAIRDYLERICSHPELRMSQRGRRCLRYLMDAWLESREVTEFALGQDVFDKSASFDPRIDSSVRAEVSRLRRAVAAYYGSVGANDVWRVRFAERGYALTIVPTNGEALGSPAAQGIFGGWRGWLLAMAAAVILISLLVLVNHRADQSKAQPSATPAGVSPAAYAIYLKGWSLLQRRGYHDFDNAIASFTQANAAEPHWAAPQAGLATALILDALYFGEHRERFTRARSAAQRALSFDPDNSEAHAALGAFHALYEYDLKSATAEFLEAIRYKPDDPQPYRWYAIMVLAPESRFDEARKEIARAASLDPSSAEPEIDEGWVDYFQGRFDAARDRYRHALTMDPASIRVRARLFELFWTTGSLHESLSQQLAIHELADQYTDSARSLLQLLDTKGKDALLHELLRLSEGFSSCGRAGMLLQVGRKSEALDSLRSTYDDHDPCFLWVGVSPQFEPLKKEPAFRALLSHISGSADARTERGNGS